MALYDKIGIGYDTTRSADPFILSRLLHHLSPAPDALYLDVGCGTANYTLAIKDTGVRIVGIDFSRAMLSRAREKSPSLLLSRARAEALPFHDAVFGGATCTFVHHHMDDSVAAFGELRRVLRPGSRLVLLNSTIEQTRHCWLSEYFPKAIARAMVPFERLNTRAALEAAAFNLVGTEPYAVKDDLRDWFLYCGKNRPDLYLDARVRAGISAFANAHDQDEIEAGVERLRRDIASGRIREVQREYGWEGGDYTITIAAR